MKGGEAIDIRPIVDEKTNVPNRIVSFIHRILAPPRWCLWHITRKGANKEIGAVRPPRHNSADGKPQEVAATTPILPLISSIE